MTTISPVVLALTVGLAFVVSLAAPLIWIPILRGLGAVDIPNARSSHLTPTVRGAGVAVATALVVATFLILILMPDERIVVSIFSASVLASLIGLVEDTRGLSIQWRLVIQLALSLVTAVVICKLTAQPVLLAIAFAVIISGYVNATNFMDGIDGISAFHGLVCGMYFAVAGAVTGHGWLTMSGAVLAAVHGGFLPWNLSSPRVFLGDCGSYLLGSMIVVTAVAASSIAPVLVCVAPAVPYLADTSMTIMRRIVRRERVCQPHRQHVYQRLVGLGFTHIASATVVALVSLVCGCAALLTKGGPAGWLACALLAVGYLSLPGLALSRRQVVNS